VWLRAPNDAEGEWHHYGAICPPRRREPAARRARPPFSRRSSQPRPTPHTPVAAYPRIPRAEGRPAVGRGHRQTSTSRCHGDGDDKTGHYRQHRHHRCGKPLPSNDLTLASGRDRGRASTSRTVATTPGAAIESRSSQPLPAPHTPGVTDPRARTQPSGARPRRPCRKTGPRRGARTQLLGTPLLGGAGCDVVYGVIGLLAAGEVVSGPPKRTILPFWILPISAPSNPPCCDPP
jgi:hypothetical protein